MSRFSKIVRFSEVDSHKMRYESAGASVRIFPYSERGLNQSNYRKLEINPPSGLREQLDYAKKIRGFK